MKLFISYLKAHKTLIASYIVFFALFLITFLLCRLPPKALLYPAFLCLIVGIIFVAVDFLRQKERHKCLLELKKQSAALITSLPDARSIESADYQEIIRTLKAEISELEAQTASRIQDTMEYYTVWVHQIETPIAAMRLTLQNEDTPLSRRALLELLRIEQYVEMVLAYLRLDSDSGDYVFNGTDLDSVIKQALAKLSSEFIDRKLRLEYEEINYEIITDEKWLSFVIEQVLSNALKYTREGKIKIFFTENKELCIEDTGIGIAPEDIPRVFEKGYTGYNGRIDKRASGIGLYLCRRICQNLGTNIRVTSKLGKGTSVYIGLEEYKKIKE